MVVGVLTASVAQAQAPDRIKIAVVDLAASGVKPDLATTLTSVVASELTRLQVFSVISNQEVRAMLSHDATMQLAGCDGTSQCPSANLVAALGAQYLVSGNIGQVGSTYTLNLVLTDVAKGAVENRAGDQVSDPGHLLDAAAHASQVLVSKVLASRSGTLVVTCSEHGATVKVDGEIVGTTPLPRRPISWGPHRVDVEKTGFIAGIEDISVNGSGLTETHFQLVPSPDFVTAYEKKAKAMRIGAWVSTGLAAASFGGAIYFEVYQSRQANNFVTMRSQYEAMANPTEAQYQQLVNAKDDVQASINKTYAFTGVGLGLTAAALYLWIAGDDPGRYADFRETAPPPAGHVSWHLFDGQGLVSMSVTTP